MTRKKIINLFLVIIIISIVFFNAASVLAFSWADITPNYSSTAGQAGYQSDQANFAKFIAGIISAILAVFGALFVALIIYGGITWMIAAETGSGDKTVARAKKIIVMAIVGFFIVAFGYTITYFVATLIEKSSGQQQEVQYTCVPSGGACVTGPCDAALNQQAIVGGTCAGGLVCCGTTQ